MSAVPGNGYPLSRISSSVIVSMDSSCSGYVSSSRSAQPSFDITVSVMPKLGWADRDEDTYPLQEESIETITDDEIRLSE